MRKLIASITALLLLFGAIAYGNYTATQGSGTTFGSIIVGGAHYAQQFVCDLVTPAQCASIDAGNNLKTSLGTVTTTLTGWTSGTSLNATQTLMTTANGAPSILVQLNQTSTLTVGAITFEGTYDGTNWVTIPVAQVLNPNTLANLTNPYTLVASTNQPFLILTQGYQSVRIKLSTQITGTATVTPFVTLLNYNPTISAVLNPIPAGSATIGKVGIDQTTVGTTNGVSIAQIGAATVSTGSGVMGTGTIRTALATDSPGIITLGTNTAANSVPMVGSTTPTIANGSGAVLAPSAETLAALTPIVSTALESNHVIKASAGNFYSGYITTGAVAGWLLLANSTTAPTAGGAAIAPIACVVVPANATTSIGGQIPIRASTGITLVFSTSGCLTNTASATAFFSGMAN